VSSRLDLRPLTACLALALAASSATELAAAGASSVRLTGATGNLGVAAGPNGPAGAVSNCDDDGSGSLRAAISVAASDDTIDFSDLACSTITLTSGALIVAQDDLTLIGPGAAALAIDGANNYGVLRHTGAGTLAVSAVTLTHGAYASQTTPRGGCLYSAANLDVADSVVSYCEARGTGGEVARGGAIYAHGNLTLTSSLVTGSRAYGTAGIGRGGGVYVNGNFDAETSTISYNTAQGAPIINGQGGGAMVLGTTLLHASSIYYNGAYEVGGIWTKSAVTVDSSLIARNGASQTAGMRATYYTGTPTATIVNSTIAYNRSVERVGGLNLIIPATISNTTIAMNEAFSGLAGVLMSGPTLELDSTIIAGNMSGPDPDDFEVYGMPVITGANNLVVASSAPLPPDTISDDPMLDVLIDNGGPTFTMALLQGSPAIDAGNNVAQLADDQRGQGYPREVGLGADIGAFEVQTSDVIFRDGFDPP
ncbi:MAG TPA: choice-of-anchor Q domain-containing protein, partial [Rhodanobacteraceae bacterium]